MNQIPGVDVPEDSKGPMDAPRPANCPVNPQGISSCGKTPAPGKTSQGIVVVGDPRIIVSDILRAAWEEKIACAAEQPATAPALFDRVIVMAQMPHTEADELGARVRAEIEKGYRHSFNRPAIDLILSEAQEEHVSPDLKLDFNRSLETPVLTSVAAYTQVNKLNPPTSQVVVSDRLWDPALRQHIENAASNTDTAYSRDQERIFDLPNCKSAACLLESQLESALTRNEVRNRVTSLPESDLTKEWKACQSVTTCEDSVLMQYLLRQIQRSSKADAVMLKRRDFYFDDLGPDNGYNLCTDWVGGLYNSLNNQNVPDPKDRDFYEGYCKLHVALDRVLWKGDYSERVMVDGTTLTTLMSIAQKQTDQDQTLLARDLTGNWLMTYGIVTQPPKNLAAAASGPGSFSVPGLMECNPAPIPLTGKGNSGESGPPYCIDGQSVASDRSYWLSTSDELAEDKAVYSALGNLTQKNPAYVRKTNGLFLTTEIAEEVLRAGQPPSRPAPPPNSPERSLASIENLHQARGLYRIDFTKLVAGYSLTHPSLTDSELADDFAGISNTQATTPHSQELDLEAATRLTYAPFLRFVTFGIQSDVEYDRKYSGNLTGSPENVAYSANSYTGGGFAQFHLSLNGGKEFARNNIDLGTRNLPRLFIVVAPYQFQSQLAPNYIPFPYYTPSITPGGSGTFSKTAFLNIQIPVTDGFSQRIGFRFEMSGRPKWSPDPGSYVEIGPEYAVLNNVLAAVRVSGLPVSVPFPTCPVTATAFQSSPSSAPTPGNPLVNCVKYDYQTVNLPLNGSSIIVPVPQTLHAGGFYWSSHVQKNVDAKKNTSLSFDTSGDSFLLPGYTLTTQTRYAFTTKLALNFKIIPSLANLTLSPTYSSFYFENQGAPLQRTSLIASTFSVSAKWYFARDAQVPLWKQSWFQGPASVDQTNSAKIK